MRADATPPAELPRNLTADLQASRARAFAADASNLFDKKPKLSFERERCGQMWLGFNIGQPHPIELTIRQRFGL